MAQQWEGQVDFVTMGMFIIDNIDFEGTTPSVYGILGGAASFAVVAARMVAGPDHAKSVSWILDVGSDFPPDMLDLINSWSTGCVIRVDQSRLTTRAWNGYGANEKRDFNYLTPKLRLEPYMLSPEQLFSKTFHMVCSSDRCIYVVTDILRRRAALLKDRNGSLGASDRPFFVWEPVPDRCTPEEQEKFFAASELVDVVSPNELELGMMFDRPGWSETCTDDQELVRKILRSGIGPHGNGVLVIRAGKDGSYAYSSKCRGLWLPAYHQPQPGRQSPVVDPTGAGNAFLGALAEGIVSEGRQPIQVIDSDLRSSAAWNRIMHTWGNEARVPKALICATTAAGFVVEQIGVPNITKTHDGKELWNGTAFTDRIHMYTQWLCKTLEGTQSHDWLAL